MTSAAGALANETPLVLLHGWGLHSGVWDEVVARLSARRTVVPVDLPGHGDRRSPVPPALDEAVDEIASTWQGPAAVCGWSLGGLLAQRIAQRHPAKVERLLLVATTPCFVRRRGWAHAMTGETLQAFAHGLELDPAATLQRFVRLNALHGKRGREAIRALEARLLAKPAPTVQALATTLAWLADTDLRAEAPRIEQPTLVVHGTRDALAPVEAGRWLAASLPNARLVEIPDAAHIPFFSHLETFVTELQEWHG